MNQLTKEQKEIIMVSVAMAIGTYFFWTKVMGPLKEEIKSMQTKLNDLNSKVETARIQSLRLPLLRQEVEQLQTELSALEKQLPKDKDVPNILRVLTKEAMQQNLVFNRLTPKQLTKKEYFEIIPFDLQFTGSLHSLGRFLSSLGQQDRIFQSQNINFTPASATGDQLGLVSLTITLTIQTYAYAG